MPPRLSQQSGEERQGDDPTLEGFSVQMQVQLWCLHPRLSHWCLPTSSEPKQPSPSLSISLHPSLHLSPSLSPSLSIHSSPSLHIALDLDPLRSILIFPTYSQIHSPATSSCAVVGTQQPQRISTALGPSLGPVVAFHGRDSTGYHFLASIPPGLRLLCAFIASILAMP